MTEATGKRKASVALPDFGLNDKQLDHVRERMQNAVVGSLKDVGVDAAERAIVVQVSIAVEF